MRGWIIGSSALRAEPLQGRKHHACFEFCWNAIVGMPSLECHRWNAIVGMPSLECHRWNAIVAKFLIVLACMPPLAWAQGFPDQGFDDGLPVVSTDFYLPSEGTSANPLTLSPCLFPSSLEPPCLASAPTIFQQSNHWNQNMPAWLCYGPYGFCDHWTLILNNEAAYNTENPGPPAASLPRSLPGYGIFGFATLYGGYNFPGDTLWRAHMVLNVSSQFPNPDTHQKTPYMAIGYWHGWGSPQEPIGVLNPSTSASFTTVEFGERVWDMIPTVTWPGSEQTRIVKAYLVVFADWGTYPKAIQVNLYHWTSVGDWPGWAILDWNWPITKSVYYPGAQFVGIDAEDVLSKCGFAVPRLENIGQEINYSVDLNALFHCADQAGKFDEPLPATADIPITSVSWATEATGRDGGIWVDVHRMRMGATGQAAQFSVAPSALTKDQTFGDTTRDIADRLDALCEAEAGCPQRHDAAKRHDPNVFDLPALTAQQWQHLGSRWNFVPTP